MYSKFVHTFYYFNIAVQSVFSLLTPIALMTLLSWFLSDRAITGKWIYAPLILLGVGVGLYSMLHFILTASAQVHALEKAEEEKQREKKIKEAKEKERKEQEREP